MGPALGGAVEDVIGDFVGLLDGSSVIPLGEIGGGVISFVGLSEGLVVGLEEVGCCVNLAVGSSVGYAVGGSCKVVVRTE